MIQIEIITTHIHTDLDGLASMILAKKLYPEARLVFSGNTNNNVREYVALFQDYLNIYRAKEIDVESISKIIIVDTNNKTRIGKFENIINDPDVEVIVFDHHEKGDKDINSTNSVIKKYGATTSIILEKLLNENIEFQLAEHEINLCMMGIYEDTGSLSYTTTTYKDVEMAAYLMKLGAKLEIINYYITKSMEEKQMEVFKSLLENGEVIDYSVDSIFLGMYESDRFIDGIDVVANKIKDVEGVDCVFVLIGNQEDSYLIGRSSTNNIRVNEIVSEFGGGGHFNAGSASIKGQDPYAVYKRLKEFVLDNIKIDKLARDIMMSPVKTAVQNSKIKDLYKIMLRFGYSGLPIVEKGQIKGIISRRDVDRAISHGFGNAPVRAYMTSHVITASLDEPMEKLKQTLIENEIGRIPIVDESDSLVGIVTRSDILRNLYENRKKRNIKEIKFEEDIKNVLKRRFPDKVNEILKKVREISENRNEKAYLVGGIIRDLLLNIENFDIDIVVEGKGVEFANDLGKLLNAKKVVFHDKFKTAVIVLQDDMKIDIASSRIEYYEYPTSLPTVEYGNIKQDLFRRDFTINAMAIEIDFSNFGKLIDYFRGYRDLQDGKIRILHSLSFIEDPTRIIRCIRFAVRYGFEIEEDTHKFIIDCIEKGFLLKLTWKRVKYEFQLILSEKNAEKAILELFKYKVFQAVHKNIHFNKTVEEDIRRATGYLSLAKKNNVEQWVLYFLVALEQLTSEEMDFVFKRFAFSKKFVEKYEFGKIRREEIISQIKNVKKNSEIYLILKHISIEVIFLLLITTRDEKVEENILNYLNNVMHIEPLIKGKDLIEMGYSGGPEFREKLEEVYLYQIDNGIKHKDELEKLI